MCLWRFWATFEFLPKLEPMKLWGQKPKSGTRWCLGWGHPPSTNKQVTINHSMDKSFRFAVSNGATYFLIYELSHWFNLWNCCFLINIPAVKTNISFYFLLVPCPHGRTCKFSFIFLCVKRRVNALLTSRSE